MKSYFFLPLSIFVLTGCVSLTGSEVPDRADIAIETVDSSLARVGKVTVTQTESTLHIDGEVLRRTVGRGPIHGHLHIEVLGADAHTLISIEDDYWRRSIKARSAQFSETLNIDPVVAKTVRITHYAQSHSH